MVTDFTKSKEMKQLCDDTEEALLRYASDVHCIIQLRSYLFAKPIESIKALNRDSLKCWCLSIEEAELLAEQCTKLHYKQYLASLLSGNKIQQ
jgi:hypothetical protein